jgi:hypothetical protein
MSRAWMQELCGGAPRTKRPFRATIDGAECDCATNGVVLLVFQGGCEFEPWAEAPPVAKVAALPFGKGEDMSLEALLEWSYTPTDRPGRLLGVPVNRRILWETLLVVPRVERVLVSANPANGSLRFEAGDWQLYVMGLREDSVPDGLPSFQPAGLA